MQIKRDCFDQAVGQGWMAEIDASYFIIRPDFYVAATAKTAEELRYRFDQVMEKLHLNIEEMQA